ncbi:type I restriction endonuclease subunit R [Halobacteriovorax sp.]|uniref:type I restriction endonuclease subunit R n=1 Tax=Halobacteriovorax sp. TaxID=2020862 RepID=UPI003AF2BDA3
MSYETDGYGPETRMVEVPILDFLCKDDLFKSNDKTVGYKYLQPAKHSQERDGETNVILRNELLAAIKRINDVDDEVANSVYQDLLNLSDNEKWLKIIKGDYSKSVPGQSDKKTIFLIDFKNTENNTFTVTNQYYVKSQHSRKPDVVIFINGIPVVVIEAKSPFAYKDKTGEAFDQIKQYERDIPRLFFSNCFNIVTNEKNTLYGATGSSSKYYGYWRNPWPKTDEDLSNDPLKKALWALLQPDNLLDLIAHFIVFEREKDKDGHTHIIKKICRYQQFRAVNKIVDRVVKDEQNKGLVWHTQGSGKSLTMVFSAIKLKTHLTLDAKTLENPNILVLTDRVDLDTQIKNTFVACGIRNPKHMTSVSQLRDTIKSEATGLTVVTTIFKFQGSKDPIPNSENWILLVDECHRTQEKDLGAYLRATFPKAKFFGFTGTPVKKNDMDTYANFSPEGEGYIDKYDIDDAVADGATVPIHHTARMTEWNVETAKMDILFDQWFANEPEEVISALKEKGISLGMLIKFPKRIDLIAYDIWTHYKAYAKPDGLKAQIVAYDREAIILYKRALNKVITADLVKSGLSQEEAEKQADEMSACVYSGNQEDAKPSEEEYIQELRGDLQKYYADKDKEIEIKDNFKTKSKEPSFLIVCSKLLTGFDAPIEGVMYVDNPLTDHNLLQAIARANRVWSEGRKDCGLIVDYIGITKKLDKALECYRKEDVQNATRDFSKLEENLTRSHEEVSAYLKEIDGNQPNLRAEFIKLIEIIETKDRWLVFKKKAKEFISAYEILSPEPFILQFQKDLKLTVAFLQYATPSFEKKEAEPLGNYSEKIRAMLDEHLEVTGLKTTIKLRKLTDPEFQNDFKTEGKSPEDIKEAATRKATELKKITREKVDDNELRYKKFSERLLEIIKLLEEKQLEASEALKEMEKLSGELNKEDKAYKDSGLTERGYDILKILEAFRYESEEKSDDDSKNEKSEGLSKEVINKLKEIAKEVEEVYASNDSAPKGWNHMEQLRKELRQKVRRILQPVKLQGWQKEIPNRVEEYALKNFIKV